MRARRGRRTAVCIAFPLIACLATSCGGDDTTSPTTTTAAPGTTTTIASSTTEAPGEQILVLDLDAGECFEERLVPGQGQSEVSELFRIDCALPHDNEVYLVAGMPDEIGAPFPGDEPVTAFADEQCLDGFEDFIGLQYELSEFEIGHLVPTEASWETPDREVVCFVFDRRGEKLEGTVRGSAR